MIAETLRKLASGEAITSYDVVELTQWAEGIKDAGALLATLFNGTDQITKLQQICQYSGTLIINAAISPEDGVTSYEPTDAGFTGVAMGGDGWTFDGTVYHFVAVAAGVLQAGFNSVGKFLAGAGKVILDADGITLQASTEHADASSIKWKYGSDLIGYIEQIYDNLTTGYMRIILGSLLDADRDQYLQIGAASSDIGKVADVSLEVNNGNINTYTIFGVSTTYGTYMSGRTEPSVNSGYGSMWYNSSSKKFYFKNDDGRVFDFETKGWMPYAYPVSFVANAAFTTAETLPTNGGSIAIPFLLTAPMLLESVSVRNANSSLQRTWGWDLYWQENNSGDSGENTLARIAACSANETFTPSAASTRTITAASAPVSLQPGLYWLVIQCRHASSTFSLGSTAASSAFAVNTAQTKTTTNPNGATLDFVAATWTKTTAIYAARLNGRVFGQTVAF